jgi:putative CocE/NonD family hydrolase
MEIDKDVYVPMRDGTHLAVDVYRPAALSRHAAVLVVTPYRKDAVFQTPLAWDGRPTPLPLPPLPEGFNPMLLTVQPLVDAGFVVVVADARGTGFSEGEYDYYNLEGGPFDGYDTVEWMAERPWCDGNVGIMGGSAAAISCYLTALTHPPHLRAMAPNMHPGDFYFDQWRVGGVFRLENRISWAMGMYANITPVHPGAPTAPSYERKRAVYEARMEQFERRLTAGRNIANLDWLTEMHRHDSYDGFWRSRSIIARAAEITIPTLHGGVWFDHFIRGTLTSHAAIDVPKRLFVGPGSLITRLDLGDGGLGALHVAWFDHFLRGADNGVMDGPAARLYLLGAEEYVDEPEWPVPTQDWELFLSPGTLSTEPAAGASVVLRHQPEDPVRTCTDAADQRPFERRCLTFTTAPLDSDVDVIGTPRLVLHAATDATDVDFCVRLCDVFEDGRSRLLNTGALKGSHVQSHEHPTALEAGTVYCLDIEIWATANRFARGHRIRVDVAASDYPFFENNPLASTTEILLDASHPSRLILPVARRSSEDRLTA